MSTWTGSHLTAEDLEYEGTIRRITRPDQSPQLFETIHYPGGKVRSTDPAACIALGVPARPPTAHGINGKTRAALATAGLPTGHAQVISYIGTKGAGMRGIRRYESKCTVPSRAVRRARQRRRNAAAKQARKVNR